MTFPLTIMVVRTDVDLEHEQAFNTWYDDVHLPEITSCPGFVRSARYINEQDGERRYLALYELEGADALDTPEFAARRGLGPFGDEVRIEVRLFTQITALEGADA